MTRPGATLEDVDRRDVGMHRTDPAGHLAERPGPVRQPHPHDQRAGVRGRIVGGHGGDHNESVPRARSRRVTTP